MQKEHTLQDPVQTATLPHQLILDGREHLTVTGVLRMLHCDDTSAAMDTSKGTLNLQGKGLSVRRLCLESGDVSIDGRVDSMVYTERITSLSFWQRILR